MLELNTMVGATLKEVFQESLWVEAELIEFRESNGHAYLELVQHEKQLIGGKSSSSGSLLAKASAKCWRGNWMRLSQKFIAALGTLPQRGMTILVSVRVDFHAQYGYALIVNDIDPAHTLGVQALKKDEILQALKEQGIAELQHELPLPLFCQNIAVISSSTAAGYGDFCDQLKNNEFGLTFNIKLFEAIMQGESSAPSIIDALGRIFDDTSTNYDAVVIIRGGGATSDLACFDDQALAEVVAQFPIPIITGIGHERDECVLDLIACVRQKTPTAVAAFLIEQLAGVLARVEEAKRTIEQESSHLLERHKQRVNELQMIIRHSASMFCTKQTARVDLVFTKLKGILINILSREDHKIKNLELRVKSLDPKRLLKKGYSLTYANGKVVKSAADLQAGQAITTVFNDGNVISIVK